MSTSMGQRTRETKSLREERQPNLFTTNWLQIPLKNNSVLIWLVWYTCTSSALCRFLLVLLSWRTHWTFVYNCVKISTPTIPLIISRTSCASDFNPVSKWETIIHIIETFRGLERKTQRLIFEIHQWMLQFVNLCSVSFARYLNISTLQRNGGYIF